MHFLSKAGFSILQLPVLVGVAIALSAQLSAAEGAAGFTVEKTAHGAAVKYKGELVTEYVVEQANKPYFWPLIGPTGKPMTRAFPMAEVEGEVKDHPHHRSLWFGHEDINGIDTWTEAATWEKSKPADKEMRLAKLGSIKHREFRELLADEQQATVADVSDYLDASGKKTMEQETRVTFRMAGEARVIDYAAEFIASEGPVRFGDQKDAGFNVRVATSMAVDSKQGGRIVNSDGIADAAAWGKRAGWVDYSGPLQGETVGIAIFDHPTNFRSPTPWHVRTYGLFTANPFGMHSLDKTAEDGAMTLAKGERLRLRYRVILHKGDEKAAKIAEAFAEYAK